ncbi:Gfo/Idh/MocA family protein [Adhaeribacter pallidiroseus]|uniref:Putative oxidoreductase YcjS n=1 Tax=Adhaeribacter pallidiroseus TaxID=2072847 RepID=A0A369QFD1_9BACT|nr:Gfo/Idh/MocA family oxidoreductase [Adhaeribacter pallidiroseus]RDC61599.1 putative oxidoreductase YcjS [Adhaeribacter pallidiroseus]
MEDKPYKIALLGTGLIGTFYTTSLHGQRRMDKVHTVYSRSEERAKTFAQQWNIPNYETDMLRAIQSADIDVVVIGLPNNLHLEAVRAAAAAGKAILCTKPLGRNAAEALEMLKIVEEAGVFHGYLEDLAYPAKTLKALSSIRNGALGKILWTRSREAHPGPHSDWFWDAQLSGGGAIIDMGCHCIEIGRNYIGKDIRPVEVMCWADTLVKPIEAEDNAIGLVRYASGAVSQFEVSWTYRGGMDLRDEVAGTEGTLRVDHFLRTGMELFTSVGEKGYVAEKAESETGWLFPVGDEAHALGYPQMFEDMFTALDKGESPMETFYDGYVVNAIMDACYLSAKTKKWEPVNLEVWRGNEAEDQQREYKEYDNNHYLIKEELLPDGRKKIILKEKSGGQLVQRVLD